MTILINYTYETDSTEYTNFAYAFGQGTGSKRKQATYYTGNSEPQRLDRYELYVDANDIADTENDNGTENGNSGGTIQAAANLSCCRKS